MSRWFSFAGPQTIRATPLVLAAWIMAGFGPWFSVVCPAAQNVPAPARESATASHSKSSGASGILLQDYPIRPVPSSYCAGKPFLSDNEAWGHAVAAAYLYSGATDVAVLEGDAELLGQVDRIWENVVTRKLFLTGGVGLPSAESFGKDYELPGARAYCETCAAIAMVLWNQRMFLTHGDAKYIDVLERILCNGFLSGVGMSGDRFFYPNPLTVPAQIPYQRVPWFGCPCCPCNIVRFLPQLPGMVFATRRGQIPLAGQTVTLTQETRYPWDAAVSITVTPERPAMPPAFSLTMTRYGLWRATT